MARFEVQISFKTARLDCQSFFDLQKGERRNEKAILCNGLVGCRLDDPNRLRPE